LIDLHCHILPGLDDGARDLEDSLAMARQADEDGVELVCATPHIRGDHDVQIDEIAWRVERLQGALGERGLRVRIAPGGELAQQQAVHLSERELRAIALGGQGGWVLLEPAPGPLGDDLERTVAELAQRGLASIVAHPERHAGEDFERRLQDLAALGCLIQWTAEFVARAGSSDLVLELARKRLVHVLGSDAHSGFAGRPVQLAGAFARLASTCAPERVRWMREDAPRAIVRGEPVSPMP
jgi:protein-tyrosine phosphatase